MKCRTSTLKHPSGDAELNTPLFVPSYSSKGFNFIKINGKQKSEICNAIKIAKEFLIESQLVSAYDLHYKYLLEPEDFISTQITFIDSGGYETSSAYDFYETRRGPYEYKDWNIEYLDSVIDAWPQERFPAILVSYDNEKHRIPLTNQIEEASRFFEKHEGYLTDFIIKPETDTSGFIKMDSILKNIDQFKKFDIVGITEKELGNSFLERMQRISKIRDVLNKNKIKAPIHIFGSLDPITTILYFMAGAEIFDGLSWLKYSYFNGLAMYTNNLCALNEDIQISTRDPQVKAHSIVKNIQYLDKLKNILINFQKSKYDFSVFKGLGDYKLSNVIEKNYMIFNNSQKK